MASMGILIGQRVAEELFQARIKRQQEEEAKATKGNSQKPDQPQPGKYGLTTSPTSGAAFGEQRMGERMDYTQPAQPEQLGNPDYWEMNPQMGLSLGGSKTFTRAEVMRGYRSLGKA